MTKAKEAHVQEPDTVHALPCPFCGALHLNLSSFPDVVGKGDTATRVSRFFVYCRKCGASGPQPVSDAEAVSGWNRRVGR